MSAETLFDLMDFEPKPTYSGSAPLNFTREYFHPDELAEATRWLRVEEGMSFGSAVGRIHTWQMGMTTGWVVPEGAAAHSMCMLNTDLGCFGIDGHGIDYGYRRDYPLAQGEHLRRVMLCSCVYATVHQAVCSVCRWHYIGGTETEIVEAWHDHAFPGWRDLPAAPQGLEGQKLAQWASEMYPEECQVPAAPIRSLRSRYGTRHVPGRSPWGGFDLSAGELAVAA